MKFYQHGTEYMEFVGIDPFLAEIIRQIPRSASPEGSVEAKARLFTSPSSQDAELQADWQEFVVPDLAKQFSTAMGQVQHDLEENLSEVEGEDDFPFRLQIRFEHADAWLSALNQARLVLAARHDFTDEELADSFHMQLTSLRDLGLYQITIYGWMQELILSALP